MPDEEIEEYPGRYTCRSCSSPTDNDSDVCDACEEEASPMTDAQDKLAGALGDIVIPVNGIYFDQIAAHKKAEEYRLVTPFWARRLVDRSYRNVVLTRGYPKGGGVEGETRLTRAWRGFTRKTIAHPHFGGQPVEVFAIWVAHPAIEKLGA